MEKIKIYLSEKESIEYEEAVAFSSIVDVCLKHFEKVLNLINLKKFKVLEYKVVEEAPHFYSFILKLEENKYAKK